MRTFTKAATVALLAGAALSMAACKKTDTTTADNSTMTEMNSTDTTMDTGANDMMATDGNMAADNTMMNSADNTGMGENNAM